MMNDEYLMMNADDWRNCTFADPYAVFANIRKLPVSPAEYSEICKVRASEGNIVYFV